MRPLVPVAVAACLAAVSPAGATGRRADAFALHAPGGKATTVFGTHPDRSYTVTVSGAYSYNGKAALSDCGHKDPESAESWGPVANVWLNGRPARCAAMPFDMTHSYRWDEPGTGAPFTFEIWTGAHDEDDVGSLVVTVVEN